MSSMVAADVEKSIRYLQLLSKQFPNVSAASREIINLQAILNLPKGTEQFLSDVHGEYEAFLHILKNGSGIIRRKIEDVFENRLRQCEKRSLATLIYYPEEILAVVDEVENELEDWYEITLHRLVLVCREVSSKYTRSKVRKALPKDFQYIIEELLHEQNHVPNKHDYYDEIIKTIIRIKQAKPFIKVLCELIQRLSVDHLHIIGDIYDRGPGADIIMDKLLNYHSLDIQWGNHDIGWMGAAAGSLVCIANTIRVCARYGNLHTLEDGYGINLRPLVKFALEVYKTTSEVFQPKENHDHGVNEIELINKIHKAITIIQFKVEGQLIKRNPHFNMENRLLLDKINYNEGNITINGMTYPLTDTDFPTIDPKNPYELTEEEDSVIKQLKKSFMKNDKLQRHMDLLLNKGSMYLIFNGNLLYHGCIPMNKEGEFESFNIDRIEYKGKSLLDQLERMARESYEGRWDDTTNHTDVFWYLCTGEKSSLFGKKKITTFERYFIKESKMHHEEKNDYYHLINKKEICVKILREFELEVNRSIVINGHVPVKVCEGESPIKADGKLLMIDGGFSKAYQNVTGIAGYTLIFNSFGMMLAAHEHFESKQKAIEEDEDIISNLTILDQRAKRIKVKDTDIGKELKMQICDLELLLYAYRKGMIKQSLQ